MYGVELLLLAVFVAACAGSDEPASPATADTAVTAVGAAPEEQPAAEEQEVSEGLKLLAHRGVHHGYSTVDLDRDACTATRIDPPEHGYFENTVPSMRAAFAAGASVVEIDIAPSVDGVLAVFHDWDLSCRTESSADIRSLTWDELSKLDVGYGYTSDGETYPLRGQGEGLMPRLEDVFAAFPDGQFLINFKSGNPEEAALLQEVVEAADAADQVWGVYGRDPAPVEAYVSATGARGFSDESIRECLGDYAAATQDDARIASCENTAVIVPMDIGSLLPGWPEAFIQTMARHGTEVIIAGPGLTRVAGIDTREDLDLLPQDLDAYIWTNKVEALN